MKKIATHNSCTGEKGYGLLSWLVTPFSRCQTKTLTEQYDAGVRYFDIRLRRTDRGVVAAHGLWESSELLLHLLYRLDKHVKETYYLAVCYEGNDRDEALWLSGWVKGHLHYARIVYTAVKKPEWRVVQYDESVPCEQAYKRLDFSTWHTLLPLPRWWKRFFFRDVEFNEKRFKMVDFV